MEWTWWQLGENIICFHWAYDECLNSLIHFMEHTLELPKLCERLFICGILSNMYLYRYICAIVVVVVGIGTIDDW